MPSEPAEMAAASEGENRDPVADALARALGIATGSARLLSGAGYHTVDEVRGLGDPELRRIGVGAADIDRIRASTEAQAATPPGRSAPEVPTTPRPGVNGEKIVERWLETVRKTERPKRRHVPLPAKDSTDVLKKWVEGDDRAMETWIQASESSRPAPSVSTPKSPSVTPTLPATGGGEAGAGTPGAPSAYPPSPGAALLQEREATVVRWLTDLLDRVKSDQFDPHALLQEVQELQRTLFDERAKRKTLEDEVEHVKRGSIAVIKYVRSREAKARDQAIQSKDAEIAELRLRLLQGGLTVETGGDGTAAPKGPTAEVTAGPDGPAPTGAKVVPDAASIKEIEDRVREEYAGKENASIGRETEMRRRIVQLEAEIRNLRSESEVVSQRARLLSLDEGSLPKNIDDRLKAFDTRERELLLRENELRTKFEEIRIGSEEIERRRAPLAYKEKELQTWETQLRTMKQALELEARRIETARAEQMSPQSQEQLKQIDDLRQELARKEDDLRSRESFLHQKMEDLESLQRKAADVQAEEIHADVVAATAAGKVRSGVRRLDDLVFGGFPTASQVLVNGPAHTGKETLSRLFIAEGLKSGIPAIWVVTDKTYTQIRDEMTAILPAYPQFEERGLVRYVDLYSRSVGITQGESTVKLIAASDKAAIDQLQTAVNTFAQDLREKAPTYRMVFESVSTLTAYLDATGMFRFLQPFVGRRKIDGAAAYYVLETGMHSESDLQTLEHMVDGSLNLKVDQLKTFLSIRGITDAQSRAWVGYTFTKKSFSLGSFSLDHIR